MDKSAVNMNDLPNEILIIIFKNLKVRDLVQCRLVCKRFLLICNDIKIPELIISNQIENIKDSWFAINKQFNHEDAIDITTYKIWRSASTFRLENVVRRLHFKGSFSDYVQLNLNKIIELEQLKIDLDECCEMEHHIDLNLPKLKILEIDNESESYFFNVTAPSLEKLKCARFEKTHIEYPSSITHLDVNEYNGNRANVLTNLQYLNVRDGYLLNSNILSVLPRLITLAYDLYIFTGETMPNLQSIVEQKHILKRSELKIYFNSVELVDLSRPKIFTAVLSTLDYQISYYHLLKDDAYCACLDYNKLMRLFQGQIPGDFFEKYAMTKDIHVDWRVRRQEHFMGFLKRFDYLSELYLYETSLDQTFFDGLHEIGNLTHLTVNCGSSQMITNYDFLFKLNILKSFNTDQDSPELFDLALTLYQRQKYFVSICFNFNGQRIEIQKEKQFINYRFAQYSFRRIILSESCTGTGLHFDGLVGKVNELKNTK